MSAGEHVPPEVVSAFGLGGAQLRPIAVGWINRTLAVEQGERRAVLQRLHPVFRGEVNDNIDACTRHLAERGVPTPRVVPTAEGETWIEAHDGPWRMLTWVDGATHAALPSLAHARAGGRFVARFHRALSDLDHTFAFTRPGAHDTEAHLAKLRRLRASDEGFPERDHADAVADAVLEAAEACPGFAREPRRVVHGDLKLTNLLFRDDAPEGPEVAALVDLDTLARGSLAIDLGDMLRSWCNTGDEADAEARVDAGVFEAAMGGYLEVAGEWLTDAERDAVVPALETLCVELASRFAADLYEDAYFGFDASRFPTRRAHNLARARAQLALGLDARRQRARLMEAMASPAATPPGETG